MANYGQMLGASLRSARELALTEIIEREANANSLEVPSDLSILNIDPGAFVNVVSGLDGWGASARRRRLARLAGWRISGDKRVSARLEDLHSVQRLGLLDALATSLGPSAFGNGTASILPHNGGGGFYGAGFFRPSVAYVWDEATKRVAQIPAHAIAAEQDGSYFEGAIANQILRSAFDSGLTGWTTFGTSINGSAIATDTTTLLFDPAIGSGIPYSIKFTAGNPHASNLTVIQTTPSIAANSFLTLSIDSIADSGVGLSWYLQRNSDAFYWNGTAFAAPVVPGGTCAVRTSLQQRPEVFPFIPTGGAPSTFTLVIGFPSGGTASRIAHLYHVQLELSKWGSSRVVSFATAASRGEVDYCYGNQSGRRSFPTLRGTMHLKVAPHVSTTRADGGTFYFFSVPYDASNYVEAFYDGVNSTKNRIVFRRRAAGANYDAAGVYTMTEETPFYVAFRWASIDGFELDELYGAAGGSNVWFDVWAGPAGSMTKLGSASGPVPTEAAKSRLQIGGKSGSCFEGRVSLVRLQQRVLTDEEMLRWGS